MSLERERRRLERAFHAALLAVGGPALVVACAGSSGGGGGPEGAGRADATLDVPPNASQAGADAATPDASAPGMRDAGAREASAADAAPVSCYQGAFEIEAGPDAGDAQDTCGYVYSCGLGGTGLVNVGCAVLDALEDGGAVALPGMTCWFAQDAGCDDDAFAPKPGGGVTILCTPCPNGGGRRPAELRRRGERVGASVGAYFAAMAYEESAAVVAFERLRDEMRGLGAPRPLLRAAMRAVRDENRHARTMARRARALGARPSDPAGEARRPRGGGGGGVNGRTVGALAAENAAEGCVRETFGALLVRWQSLHARDAGLRAELARVAADEARHAALSWEVARWVAPRLDEASRRRVERARRRAIREVAESLDVEPPRALVVEAGLPRAAEARALFRRLVCELDAAV